MTGVGLRQLVGRLAALVDQDRSRQPEPRRRRRHPPAPARGLRRRAGRARGFRVTGRAAERAVALNDVTTDEAAAFVQDRLRRLGVDRALARAGAADGDLVLIGELSFEWFRDQPDLTVEPGRRRR